MACFTLNSKNRQMLADMLEVAYDGMVVAKPEFDYDRLAQFIDEIIASTGPIEITVVADQPQLQRECDQAIEERIDAHVYDEDGLIQVA